MPKKKPGVPVMRERLLAAVENTPEDALFLAGLAVNKHEDFLKGLCLNRSRYFTRAQVLEQIERSAFQVFPAIPGFDDHLLLTPGCTSGRTASTDPSGFRQRRRPTPIRMFRANPTPTMTFSFVWTLSGKLSSLPLAKGKRRFQ